MLNRTAGSGQDSSNNILKLPQGRRSHKHGVDSPHLFFRLKSLNSSQMFPEERLWTKTKTRGRVGGTTQTEGGGNRCRPLRSVNTGTRTPSHARTGTLGAEPSAANALSVRFRSRQQNKKHLNGTSDHTRSFSSHCRQNQQ